ncbi:MAG TPA: tripartite tricarboxylate transporter TctB family protein [Methylomirabilota bacterium]|nr:tripartite tricarboxylate transporter TctB family protein [Methylomirabilota bacterium]
MRSADRVASVALILFAAWFAVIGRRFPYWHPDTGPGSGFLPVWLAIALATLATLLFVNAGAASGDGRWLPDRAVLGRLALILLASVVFVAALDVVGMIVGTALFLVFVLRVVERYRWATVLGVALAAAVVNYLVFTQWLRVPFPTGVLGI